MWRELHNTQDHQHHHADPTRAHEDLGWSPQVKFTELIKVMVDADTRALSLKPVGEGDALLKKLFPHRWWGHD